MPMTKDLSNMRINRITPKHPHMEKSFEILANVPPQVFLEIIETFSHTIKANKIMEGRQQEFEHQLTLIKETNLDTKERINMLVQLLQSQDFPEKAQMTLVETICKIAEEK